MSDMTKIRDLEELKALEFGYVWAWSSWDGYSIWYWNDGLGEMAPTDTAMHYRTDRIPDDMFPMYTVPEPPPKPETVDALPGAMRGLEDGDAG